MLPELAICVKLVFVFFFKAKRRCVASYRKNSAGREVNADTYNVFAADARLGKHISDYKLKHINVILRMLKRGILRKSFVASGKIFVDHCVRVIHSRIGYLVSVLYIDENRTSRKCTEVKSYCIFWHYVFSFQVSKLIRSMIYLLYITLFFLSISGAGNR